MKLVLILTFSLLSCGKSIKGLLKSFDPSAVRIDESLEFPLNLYETMFFVLDGKFIEQAEVPHFLTYVKERPDLVESIKKARSKKAQFQTLDELGDFVKEFEDILTKDLQNKIDGDSLRALFDFKIQDPHPLTREEFSQIKRLECASVKRLESLSGTEEKSNIEFIQVLLNKIDRDPLKVSMYLKMKKECMDLIAMAGKYDEPIEDASIMEIIEKLAIFRISARIDGLDVCIEDIKQYFELYHKNFKDFLKGYSTLGEFKETLDSLVQKGAKVETIEPESKLADLYKGFVRYNNSTRKYKLRVYDKMFVMIDLMKRLRLYDSLFKKINKYRHHFLQNLQAKEDEGALGDDKLAYYLSFFADTVTGVSSLYGPRFPNKTGSNLPNAFFFFLENVLKNRVEFADSSPKKKCFAELGALTDTMLRVFDDDDVAKSIMRGMDNEIVSRECLELEEYSFICLLKKSSEEILEFLRDLKDGKYNPLIGEIEKLIEQINNDPRKACDNIRSTERYKQSCLPITPVLVDEKI